MEDREILYVRTIAKYKSITKAAEQLFIAQPSLTQALHRIEEDYGAPFFQRSKAGLSLTDAGRLYLETADKIERIYADAKAELSGKAGTRHIDFGTTSIQGGILLPDFLRRFSDKYPDVELKLWEKSPGILEQLLAEGQIDMALLHRPLRNESLAFYPVYKEPLLLAISPEDPDYLRAAHGKDAPVCTAKLLADKNFLMPDSVLRIRQMVNSICLLAGITPHVGFTTGSMMTAMSMAGQGMGVTIIPRYLANSYKAKFGFATMEVPPTWNARWELVVAYRGNYVLPANCKNAIDILKETIASMPEIFE